MYWGSVRFFKHLILAILVVLAVAGFSLAAVGGLQCRSLRQEKEDLVSAVVKLQQKNEEYSQVQGLLQSSPDQVYSLCQKNGITMEQLVASLREADTPAFEQACRAALDGTQEQPAYTQLYSDLYVDPPVVSQSADHTVYLTFDDGPSINTDTILAVLEKNGIQATFFVSPSRDGSDAARLQKIAQAGHAIGVHSTSHDYQEVYASVESFLDDFAVTSQLVEEATGQKPTIFRFAGGSINQFNRLIYKNLVSEMIRRGYTYYDWNVDGGETGRTVTSASIAATVTNAMLGRNSAVVLLHDGPSRENTAAALERIVATLQERGYAFEKLTNTVRPVVFGYALD